MDLQTVIAVFSGPFISIISLSVGVFGVWFGIKNYKVDPKPIYQDWRYPIIDEEITRDSNIETKFKGTKVTRLSQYIMIFWNAGDKTLDSKNIDQNDPLRIEFEEGTQILDVNQFNEKNLSTHELSYNIDNNILYFNFDYLEKNEGFKIEILHNGINKKPNGIKGRIKGIPNGVIYDGITPPEKFESISLPKFLQPIKKTKNIFLSLSVFSGLMSIAGCYLLINAQIVFNYENITPIILNSIYFTLFFALYLTFRKIEKQKPPQHLRLDNLTSKL